MWRVKVMSNRWLFLETYTKISSSHSPSLPKTFWYEWSLHLSTTLLTQVFLHIQFHIKVFYNDTRSGDCYILWCSLVYLTNSIWSHFNLIYCLLEYSSKTIDVAIYDCLFCNTRSSTNWLRIRTSVIWTSDVIELIEAIRVSPTSTCLKSVRCNCT